MNTRLHFVTGTDTGVGKTLLACLLTRYLREQGRSVLALKPVSSGGRDDAIALAEAQGGILSLDQVNPWHFRAPLAPLLAARLEHRRVRFDDVVAHSRHFRACAEVVVIEGAGGLLSPLGVGFSNREWISALRAWPVVVCPNRLGAINQVMLVLDALSQGASRQARVVLVSTEEPDASAVSNRALLAELLGSHRVHVLPRLASQVLRNSAAWPPALRAMLQNLAQA